MSKWKHSFAALACSKSVDTWVALPENEKEWTKEFFEEVKDAAKALSPHLIQQPTGVVQ